MSTHLLSMNSRQQCVSELPHFPAYLDSPFGLSRCVTAVWSRLLLSPATSVHEIKGRSIGLSIGEFVL